MRRSFEGQSDRLLDSSSPETPGGPPSVTLPPRPPGTGCTRTSRESLLFSPGITSQEKSVHSRSLYSPQLSQAPPLHPLATTENTCIISSFRGGLSEWSMVADLKSAGRKPRGFESLALRHTNSESHRKKWCVKRVPAGDIFTHRLYWKVSGPPFGVFRAS